MRVGGMIKIQTKVTNNNIFELKPKYKLTHRLLTCNMHEGDKELSDEMSTSVYQKHKDAYLLTHFVILNFT